MKISRTYAACMVQCTSQIIQAQLITGDGDYYLGYLFLLPIAHLVSYHMIKNSELIHTRDTSAITLTFSVEKLQAAHAQISESIKKSHEGIKPGATNIYRSHINRGDYHMFVKVSLFTHYI